MRLFIILLSFLLVNTRYTFAERLEASAGKQGAYVFSQSSSQRGDPILGFNYYVYLTKLPLEDPLLTIDPTPDKLVNEPAASAALAAEAARINLRIEFVRNRKILAVCRAPAEKIIIAQELSNDGVATLVAYAHSTFPYGAPSFSSETAYPSSCVNARNTNKKIPSLRAGDIARLKYGESTLLARARLEACAGKKCRGKNYKRET